MSPRKTRELAHGDVRLALHTLRDGEGRPLLLLHALGECSPEKVPDDVAAWPGPVFALDFTGHGESTVPVGGGYSAEQMLGDADAALQDLGRATVLGRGLGAYVALLLSGGRPKQVRGAILCDGPGLTGGGGAPGEPTPPTQPDDRPAPPDPFAVAELSGDIRPPDYAQTFADQAVGLSGIAEPITVCAAERPPWLAGLLGRAGIAQKSVAQALLDCASAGE